MPDADVLLNTLYYIKPKRIVTPYLHWLADVSHIRETITAVLVLSSGLSNNVCLKATSRLAKMILDMFAVAHNRAAISTKNKLVYEYK
jgi:hypothetical protein